MRSFPWRVLLAAVVSVHNFRAIAADYTITAGLTDTTQKSVGGTDSVSVDQGGSLSVNDTAVKWNNASTDLRILNAGIIESTESEGRAINAGGSATSPRVITLTNSAGGIIRSEDDAFRINTDITDTTAGGVHVINSGTIISTVDGQAIDFDAVNSTPDGVIRIDNLATGVIQSTDADAVRPGQGAIVDNAGLIYAGKVLNDSSDGIDFQAHSGTVINEVGGMISGARHGITTSNDVMVVNYGTILGRNGSGVGSDGSATVINYGRITGAYDGSGTGDGDGVDLDTGGYVENYGEIEALGAAGVHASDGHPNGSDGVTIGGAGGTVINHAGATIYSVGGAVPITQGIVINDGTITGGSIGVLFATGSGTLTNTGVISGVVIGALGSPADDVFTNSGTISSPSVAVQMGAGNDQLTLLPGSVLIGTVDGGDGTDQVTLSGNGSGSFAGAVNFEHLQVASGNWTLTGASTFTDGTTIASGASLIGSAEVLTGAIDNSGQLIVNQPTDGAFAATLTGAGQFVKQGGGMLTIGDQAFTGTTLISAGVLNVIGALPSAVSVASGGTLAGSGTIASLTVQNGGVLLTAPGGGGTVTVNGNLVQKAGSIYVIASVGGADITGISVGGTATIEPGARLAISADNRLGLIGTRFVILKAAGGIDGSYTVTRGQVSQAVTPQPLTEIRQFISANEIDALVVRTGYSLSVTATTPNQQKVATALGALGANSSAYAALTADPSDPAVRAGLSTLSGDIHASMRTAQVQDTLIVQDATRIRLGDLSSEHPGLWNQFVGAHGLDDGVSGAARDDRDTFGGMAGADIAVRRAFRVGLAAGYTHTRMIFADDEGRGRMGSIHLIGYAGADFGAIALRSGGGFTWDRVSTSRTLNISGISDRDNARYHGHRAHGYAEIGYNLPVRGAVIKPYLRGTIVHSVLNDFAEQGGTAALVGAVQSATTGFSDAGAQFAFPLRRDISFTVDASWRHAYGPVVSSATYAFAVGGPSFQVDGTTLSRDAANVSLGIGWKLIDGLQVGLGYTGLYGKDGVSQGGRVVLSDSF